jgi:exosome complex exonuclease DIS3/RRP44
VSFSLWLYPSSDVNPRETAVVRQESESPNDRNDRGNVECILWITKNQTFVLGIRKASAWYTKHLKLTRPAVRGHLAQLPTIVLLTEDAANREKAGKEGITAMSG